MVAVPLSVRPFLPTLSEASLVRLALGVVYVVWGSTYLVLRVVVESMPALLSGGIRFVLAGAMLFAFLAWRGAPMPTRGQWLAVVPVGILLCLVANGLTSIAEREVSSGFAAVVCATVPLWITGFGAIGGERPSRLAIASLVLGLAGVAVMVGPELGGVSGSSWLVLLSPVGWALGSYAMRRMDLPKGAMAAAMQMLVGGAANLAVGGAIGERFTAMPPTLALLALAYLVVFGSILAFSAYAFLLRTTSPAVATSYAYVNPIIAVALGVLVLGETLRLSTVIGGAVVVGAVALVVRQSAGKRS